MSASAPLPEGISMTQPSQTVPTQFVPATKRTALVTGASGLAGGYMLAHLLEQGGWDIVAVSRRKPQIAGDYRYIAVDLLDPADCRTKLGPLTNISHLFYLAITERSDPSETVSANSNMFRSYIAVDLLDPADCRTKLGPLTNISHLFYLAITERSDPSETVSANSNMF